VIAAAIVGALAVATVVVIAETGGDGFPDDVLGYERLHGGEADRAEQVMEGIRVGDLEISAAVYGEGDTARLVAVIYGNYPRNVQIGSIVDGMSTGMESSGGTVDQASLETAHGGGYRFACVEASGPGLLVPGGPSEDGVACVFSGEATGLVITTHSTISITGLQDVRAFVDAYRAA
jgi:hypothetical protein